MVILITMVRTALNYSNGEARKTPLRCSATKAIQTTGIHDASTTGVHLQLYDE